MTDPSRIEELLQGEVDGGLTPAEKAELARTLLQDPAARQQRDDLARTDALLRTVPTVDPPVGLRQSILAALGLREGEVAADSMSGGLGRYRLAAAILAGLVVVGLGYRLVSHETDLGNLQGSLSRHAAMDAIVLQAGRSDVTARLVRGEAGSILELELSGLEPVEVIGEYDPAAMTPQHSALEGPGSTAGRFSIVLRPAEAHQSIEFTGSGPIRLEVRADGQRTDTTTLGSDPQD